MVVSLAFPAAITMLWRGFDTTHGAEEGWPKISLTQIESIRNHRDQWHEFLGRLRQADRSSAIAPRTA